jgi:hypothetical protein
MRLQFREAHNAIREEKRKFICILVKSDFGILSCPTTEKTGDRSSRQPSRCYAQDVSFVPVSAKKIELPFMDQLSKSSKRGNQTRSRQRNGS